MLTKAKAKAAAAAAGKQVIVVKRGWLSKRQKGEWRGWRRRLFELHSNGHLRYYRNARVRACRSLPLASSIGHEL